MSWARSQKSRLLNGIAASLKLSSPACSILNKPKMRVKRFAILLAMRFAQHRGNETFTYPRVVYLF
jgi:hypothetical protein